MNDIDRLKNAYRDYEQNDCNKRVWSIRKKGNTLMLGSLKNKLTNMLKKYVKGDLEYKKVLEIGCAGADLLMYLFGDKINHSNLYGIDIREHRVIDGMRKYPDINLKSGDARNILFGDEMFDMVMQSTVFSSILDDAICRDISKEMLRVLKRDGIIIWYDVRFPNPFNPNVRRMGRRKISDFFKGCDIELLPITLIPALARLLAPLSTGLCALLEKADILRSHYLAIIRKP